MSSRVMHLSPRETILASTFGRFSALEKLNFAATMPTGSNPPASLITEGVSTLNRESTWGWIDDGEEEVHGKAIFADRLHAGRGVSLKNRPLDDRHSVTLVGEDQGSAVAPERRRKRGSLPDVESRFGDTPSGHKLADPMTTCFSKWCCHPSPLPDLAILPPATLPQTYAQARRRISIPDATAAELDKMLPKEWVEDDLLVEGSRMPTPMTPRGTSPYQESKLLSEEEEADNEQALDDYFARMRGTAAKPRPLAPRVTAWARRAAAESQIQKASLAHLKLRSWAHRRGDTSEGKLGAVESSLVSQRGSETPQAQERTSDTRRSTSATETRRGGRHELSRSQSSSRGHRPPTKSDPSFPPPTVHVSALRSARSRSYSSLHQQDPLMSSRIPLRMRHANAPNVRASSTQRSPSPRAAPETWSAMSPESLAVRFFKVKGRFSDDDDDDDDDDDNNQPVPSSESRQHRVAQVSLSNSHQSPSQRQIRCTNDSSPLHLPLIPSIGPSNNNPAVQMHSSFTKPLSQSDDYLPTPHEPPIAPPKEVPASPLASLPCIQKSILKSTRPDNSRIYDIDRSMKGEDTVPIEGARTHGVESGVMFERLPLTTRRKEHVVSTNHSPPIGRKKAAPAKPIPDLNYRRNSVEEFARQFESLSSLSQLTASDSGESSKSRRRSSVTHLINGILTEGTSMMPNDDDGPTSASSGSATFQGNPKGRALSMLDVPSMMDSGLVEEEERDAVGSSLSDFMQTTRLKSSTSTRTRAALLRFQKQVPCEAVVLKPDGQLKLEANFSIRLDSENRQVTLSRGKHSKAYALCQLIQVDASTKCLLRAQRQTAKERRSMWDSIRPAILQKTYRLCCLRFQDRAIPVMLLFESLQDLQDFMELIGLSVRALMAENGTSLTVRFYQLNVDTAQSQGDGQIR